MNLFGDVKDMKKTFEMAGRQGKNSFIVSSLINSSNKKETEVHIFNLPYLIF